MPNKEFAERMGLSSIKKVLFGVVGRKFDKMAQKKNQKYYFLFVNENGAQLSQISKIFEQNKIQPLKKVDNGGSKGKTLIKIN